MTANLLNSLHKTWLYSLLLLPFLSPHALMAQEGAVPAPGEVLVSEVLFNPPDDGADYVELYNAGTTTLSLQEVVLVKMKSDGTMGRFYPLCDSCLLPPQRWLVVTTDATWLRQNHTVADLPRLVEVPALPALANDKGIVLVARKDSTVLDRFDYTEKMHNPLLRNKEGVALERQSYNHPTQNSDNWHSASSLCGYGTPTAANSVSNEHLFIYDDFETPSPTFSPDGDGEDDSFAINYTLTDPTLACNVTVFDIHGRRVCRPARGLLLGATGTLYWDGRNDQGTLCSPGNYVVHIDAYNTRGHRQQHKLVATLLLH